MRGIASNLDSSADRFLSLDLNGDGKSDLLQYRPGGGYASAYLSHGDGTFRRVDYVDGGTSYNGFPGNLSSSKDAFVALDVNGDGKSDFIEYRPGSGFTFLCLSLGDGSVNCRSLSTPSGPAYGFNDSMTQGNEQIVAEDLNGDGKSDFIVYAPEGGFAHAYLSNGDGTVNEVKLIDQGLGVPAAGFPTYEGMAANNAVITPLDYDGDGAADLLLRSGDVLHLYHNNRNNTFTLYTLGTLNSSSNGFTGHAGEQDAHFIVLDLNGDGKSDFLWWEAGSGFVAGYLSNGNATFKALPYQSNGTNLPGFISNAGSSSDTAIALNLGSSRGFLWYTPGKNNVVYYSYSPESGALTPKVLASNGATSGGFQDNDLYPNSTALAVNFRGFSDSGGFLWYAPGTSSLLQAYTDVNGTGSDLNFYNFTTYQATYLSDLNWSIGNIPLKQINAAGTHDSAMYGLVLGTTDPSETQYGDIPYQLNQGARYFDFRTSYFVFSGASPYDVNGNFYLIDTPNAIESDDFIMFGHSGIITGYETKDFLNQMESWLIQNPNEVILLDLANTKLQGSQRDATTKFSELLSSTQEPDLIYTQPAACGATHCVNPINFPQNMTINHLKTRGGRYGARLILVNAPGELQSLGWGWGSVNTQVGYCDPGESYAADEINCINNGGGGGAALGQLRPAYLPADADPNFTHIVAALTPVFGKLLNSPIQFADGFGGSNGFNNGSDPNDLNQQLQNGAWSANATNMWTIDGLGGDNVQQLLIQRNNQTWRNAGFFNNRAPQPAGAVAAGLNGTVWAAGSGHSTSIFQFNPNNGIWTDKFNSAPNVKKLAADNKGGLWVVEGGSDPKTGPLVYYTPAGAKTTTTSVVQDVAVGADGSVWAIGINGALFNVYSGSTVVPSSIPAQSGVRLAVDNRGYPWVVQSNGTLQRFNGTTWVQVSNVTADEIAISAEGSVFISGHDQAGVGRLNRLSNSFDFFRMDAFHITVDATGHPWAISQTTGGVYAGALDQM